MGQGWVMGDGRVQAVAVLNRAEAAVRGETGAADKDEANGRAFVDVMAGRLPHVECAAAEAQGRAVEKAVVEAVKEVQRSAARVRKATDQLLRAYRAPLQPFPFLSFSASASMASVYQSQPSTATTRTS